VKLAIGALVVVIALHAIAMLLFLPRVSDIDELGLFNPIYMKLHYGRMTYPVYGHFQAMFVHPPTRYAEIAAMMRLGLTLPYAEGFMVFVLTIAIAFAISSARFQGLSKLALLFGFFAALTWVTQTDDRTYSLRPDTELALAWFLGLVLLQDGLRRHWDLRRVFLGSFFLTYSSGLHYYGVVAFFGVLYYLVRLRSQLHSKVFWRIFLTILGGGCLFGIPYLVLFVIPNVWDIISFSHQVQSAGTWYTPILRHFEQYSHWLNQTPTTPVGLYALLYPFLRWKVPLFLVGSVLLVLKKDVRGIGIASLPLTTFVFAYSQGKSAGYFLPELLIYFCGIGLLTGLMLRTLAARAMAGDARGAAVPIVMSLATCGVTQLGHPVYFHLLWQRQVPAMDVARASAKQLVGPDAFIGGRIGLWYVSGAQRWYEISPDLLWQKDISGIDLHNYFSQFDDIVEHDHMSNTTVNAQLESLPSWYVSSLLKLKGFFVADQHDNLNFLIFSTAPSKLAGYIFEKGRLVRFDESPEGDWVFVSRLCGFESWPPVNSFDLPHFNAIYLPKASSQDRARSILPEAHPGAAQSAVVTSVFPASELEWRSQTLDRACSVLDTSRGSLTEVNLEMLLENWTRNEQPMQFYKNVEDVIASKLEADTLALPSFDLNHLQLAYEKARITGQASKIVTTAAQRYSYAAALEIPDGLPDPSWVAIKKRVLKGQVGIGILEVAKNDFMTRRFIDQEQDFATIYLPLKPTSGSRMLIIENGDTPGRSSEIAIEQVQVISSRARNKVAK
jgi:hypothetical protein